MISNKFIILTPGRSGSTYLQQLLDSNSVIKCYDEIFNVTNKNEHSFHSFCNTHYPKISYFFLRGKLSGLSWNLPLKYLIQRYLRWLYAERRGNKTGFKLIYHQLLYYRPLAIWVSNNPIPIIHLQRKNLLKAAISLIKARSTGIYTSTSISASTHQKTIIDPHTILRELRCLSDEKLKCQAIIHNHPTLTIYYEDLFESLPSTIQQLVDFLQIENVSFQKPDIVKTNPERISEIIQNYEELERALKGTEWEKLMD